jgi:hypothetical protein
MSERLIESTFGQRFEPTRVRVNQNWFRFYAGSVSNCPLVDHNNSDGLCMK